jgi:6-pyruvoyltetrahydropterin/6-carboxytetrahydropterin synthase
MKVAKRFHFYAAHRNEEIGGKCANLHGHRYGLEVEVEYPQHGSVTILFEHLEEMVEPIVEALDHSLLLHLHDPAASGLVASGACGKIYWLDVPTSAENVARHIFQKLYMGGVEVVRVALQETDSSTVTVENTV